MSTKPLTINPGGKLAIADVVGRDQHVARYWKVLRRQSMVLSAERRLGKTRVVMKMDEEGCGLTRVMASQHSCFAGP